MKKAKIILIVISLWFVIHEVSIVIDGLTDEVVNCDYGIIFGNTVNLDGTLSDRLQARTNKGFQLYKNAIVKKLFVSGGLGKEGHYEAEVMVDYLINKGVLKKDIIIDNNGVNTISTALNFKKNIPNAKSAIVITQYYHISRAKLACSKVGIEEVTGASPAYYEKRDAYSLFREFFGYYKYLIRY